MFHWNYNMAFCRRPGPAVAIVGLLALCAAVMVLFPSSSNAGDEGADAVAKVMGHANCVDCHRMEVAAWQKSTHAVKVFDYLLDPHALEYANKMGIEAGQITRSSMCLDCHATPAKNGLGHPRPLAGVSCEACHNPAGGEHGWLNTHAVYGPVGTRREEETPDHYAQRLERCRQAGQIRAADLYLTAKRCLSCHIVGNEKLVDTAKHKLSGDRFELLKHMSGEVRHNFHLNRKDNALVSSLWTSDPRHSNRTKEARMRVVYVVGQLVKAETVLRNLAAAEDSEGDYAAGLASLFEETLDNLEDSGVDELADLADQQRDLCNRLLDGDFDQGDKDILETADKFRKQARQSATSDGSSLKDVEIPTIEDELKKAYRP